MAGERVKSAQRIGLLASEYPPYIYGGLGTHVHALTSALARDNVEIELFVPDRQGGYEPPPPQVDLHAVTVDHPRSDTEFWLHYCTRVVAQAQSLGKSIELVHCHDWMTVLAGIRLRELLGLPLIFSVHLPQRGGPNLAMENLGLTYADAVLVNSHAVAQEIVERGLQTNSLQIIPNGVDLARFVPARSSSPERYILFVGRLVAQKGVDVALRAFNVLLHRCPEVRMIVVGDGDLALYYQRVGRYLGLAPRVSFVGWQTGQALVQLYQGAEVVVMPSFYEPFGMVALEAMACGRPVIATRTGGLEEVIEDGVNGYLVPTGDYLQLAQRVATLLLEPERAAILGAAAQVRASMFGWERIASTTERLYGQLIHGREALSQGKPARLVSEFIQSVDPDLRVLAKQLVSEL